MCIYKILDRNSKLVNNVTLQEMGRINIIFTKNFHWNVQRCRKANNLMLLIIFIWKINLIAGHLQTEKNVCSEYIIVVNFRPSRLKSNVSSYYFH